MTECVLWYLNHNPLTEYPKEGSLVVSATGKIQVCTCCIMLINYAYKLLSYSFKNFPNFLLVSYSYGKLTTKFAEFKN